MVLEPEKFYVLNVDVWMLTETLASWAAETELNVKQVPRQELAYRIMGGPPAWKYVKSSRYFGPNRHRSGRLGLVENG